MYKTFRFARLRLNWAIQCLTTWISEPLTLCKDDLFLSRIVRNHCLFLKNSDNQKDNVLKYNNSTCSHTLRRILPFYAPKNKQEFVETILR